jgi:hypothetical protein
VVVVHNLCVESLLLLRYRTSLTPHQATLTLMFRLVAGTIIVGVSFITYSWTENLEKATSMFATPCAMILISTLLSAMFRHSFANQSPNR